MPGVLRPIRRSRPRSCQVPRPSLLKSPSTHTSIAGCYPPLTSESILNTSFRSRTARRQGQDTMAAHLCSRSRPRRSRRNPPEAASLKAFRRHPRRRPTLPHQLPVPPPQARLPQHKTINSRRPIRTSSRSWRPGIRSHALAINRPSMTSISGKEAFGLTLACGSIPVLDYRQPVGHTFHSTIIYLMATGENSTSPTELRPPCRKRW